MCPQHRICPLLFQMETGQHTKISLPLNSEKKTTTYNTILATPISLALQIVSALFYLAQELAH